MIRFYFIIFFNVISSLLLAGSIDSINARTENKLTADTIIIRTDSSAIDTSKISKTDTTKIDSLKLLKQPPLIPILSTPLIESPFNNINSTDIRFNDYRFTGDFLNKYSSGFVRDLGSLGQPSEVMIYGNGFQSISYLADGQLINSRLYNSVDLNFIQSEHIDSIEVIPSVRGFVYGIRNNESAVNFIPRESFNSESRTSPFSRVRYYQAPNEEAMIDAMYRTYASKKLIVLGEMTNRSLSAGYTNSDFGIWNFLVNTQYLFSNEFNFLVSYNYTKSKVGLFGGLSATTDAFNEQLNNSAVRFPSRYRKDTQHNLNLTLRNKFDNLTGSVNLYYNYELMEFRQNELNTDTTLQRIFNNNRSRTGGFNISEGFSSNLFSFDLFGGYEISNHLLALTNSKENINSAYLSGVVGFKFFNENIIPSFFYKYLLYDSKSFPGIGADIIFKINDNFSFYTGLSSFQKPITFVEQSIHSGAPFNSNRILKEASIKSAEGGLNLKINGIDTKFNIFYRDYKNELVPLINSNEQIINFSQYSSKVTGAGLNLNINIWKVLLESRSAYYYYERDEIRKFKLPEFTFNGGIYFKDVLFENNLNLKTGLTFYAAGKQDFYLYDFQNYFTSGLLYESGIIADINSMLEPYFQMDFTFIGEIQKRAILYITVENLLDKKYSIVPFYQKQGRGFRLGVAWDFIN